MLGEALGYAFMQKAVLAALLSSIACGMVGTLVVINRLSSLTGSIAHAAFGGLGLSYLTGTSPMLGAAVFALGAGAGIGAVSNRYPGRSDTAIAAFWAIGMAMGLVFIDLAPGYAVDLMSYLFGSILAVPSSDLYLMAGLDLLAAVFVVLMYRDLLSVSYDREFSRTRGLPTELLFMLLICVISLTVVMLMRVVGLIMVIAMMTIPASIARMFLSGVRSMMFCATLLAGLFSLAGLALAWVLDLPAGAVIILVSGLAYFTALFLRRRRPSV